MLPGNKLFPTLAVGSLPRDQWVFDVVEARNEGRIGAAEADVLLDWAVMSAVRMQEQAGLDFVSDGEWRRNSHLHVFFDAVVSPILQRRRPLCLSDAAFLKENARARAIATRAPQS